MKKVKDHLNEQRIWDIFTVSEDSDLFKASKLMYKNKIGALMISKAGYSSNLSKLDDLADVTNLQNATNTAIDIANSVLYVVAATSDALSSIDISSPSSLSILDTFTFPTENLLGGIALNIDGPNATNAWD